MGIKWVGMDKAQRFLNGAPVEVKRAVAGVLYREGERIMAESQTRYVPVDVGTLKGSGHVKRPDIGRNKVSVELGYGGAAKAYALIQHEAEHFKHKVGGPKYLERPVNAAAGQVNTAVGKAIKDALS
jgi:hypothetical protein